MMGNAVLICPCWAHAARLFGSTKNPSRSSSVRWRSGGSVDFRMISCLGAWVKPRYCQCWGIIPWIINCLGPGSSSQMLLVMANTKSPAAGSWVPAPPGTTSCYQCWDQPPAMKDHRLAIAPQELMKRGKDGTGSVKKTVVAPSAAASKRFGNIKFKEKRDGKGDGREGDEGREGGGEVEDLKSCETYALKNLSKGYVAPWTKRRGADLPLGACREEWHAEQCDQREERAADETFNSDQHLHLLLELALGGELYATYNKKNLWGQEPSGPGTGGGDAAMVDWWCLGILTFELCSGHPPFESATPMQIYSKAQHGSWWIHPWLLIGSAPVNPLELPGERLPMKKGGTQNIKNQAWFEGFGWDEMANFTLSPPYKPTVKSKKDIANFSANKEDMPPQIPYKDRRFPRLANKFRSRVGQPLHMSPVPLVYHD
eukprot:Skav218721  [mRNA]  locus=scaffold1346:725526:731735:+ [translate_table: standard]